MSCSNCGAALAPESRFCPSCGATLAAGSRPVLAQSAQDEKTVAMLCHLTALAGIVVPFGNLIGPLIVWLMKRDTSPLADSTGKESLNFQISMTIYLLCSFLLVFIVIGIPLMMVLGIIDIALTIVAAIKTANGEAYAYPFTIRFLR